MLLLLLLEAIYGICTERLLIKQQDCNPVFSWFVGLNPDDPVWDPTTDGLRPPSATPRTATAGSERN